MPGAENRFRPRKDLNPSSGEREGEEELGHAENKESNPGGMTNT